MTGEKRLTQKEFIYSYYRERPGQTIAHAEVVDWATTAYLAKYHKPLRDPDRMIRSLRQEGRLIKDGKGRYRYEPGLEDGRELTPFSAAQKRAIFERDSYRCVICGAGPNEGNELHADHVKPVDRGGESTVENGQTLCQTHNNRKKNLGQTETGKKMFIRLLESARSSSDDELVAFIVDVLRKYDEHGINSHIVWRE